MDFYIRGDIHGDVSELREYGAGDAVILLGDAGLNYFCSKLDRDRKKKANDYGCLIYIVRGNHECRPQSIMGMKAVEDKIVGGLVYMEDEFPNIRYFMDFGLYIINGYKCAVIGGAYSVDKEWRLKNHYAWFEDEQLSELEKIECEELMYQISVDFVFSHTTATEYIPTELFLPVIDQSTVDTSMEEFISYILSQMEWKYHCFGHYHGDMFIQPGVQLFYHYDEKMDTIANRWDYYRTHGEFEDYADACHRKSQYFYMK